MDDTSEMKVKFTLTGINELKQDCSRAIDKIKKNLELDPLMQERMIQFYGSTIYYLSILEELQKTETP
ncbi:hypothetical protein [Aquimarina latercula]|uniref:hypothetical protein n=1 Tax=Aquimarina latercula TaxID=987 RepID=UPI0004140639|nr:hypothetical protein [Aquimarina latercula]